MYRRILLAYDGSIEGRKALREGALLAKRFEATVCLLSVIGGAGVQMAEGAHAGAVSHQLGQLKAIFDEGVARLTSLGLPSIGRLVVGDPAEEIRKFASEARADLIVVGHRRKSMLERWWSGPSGAYLADQVGCSILISRNTISDEEFERAFTRAAESNP